MGGAEANRAQLFGFMVTIRSIVENLGGTKVDGFGERMVEG